jgi:PAS domain S-box-containing protein
MIGEIISTASPAVMLLLSAAMPTSVYALFVILLVLVIVATVAALRLYAANRMLRAEHEARKAAETQRKNDEEQKEKALRREKALEHSLFDTAAAALLCLDAQGRIVRVNRALCRITGYSETELLGEPCPLCELGGGTACSAIRPDEPPPDSQEAVLRAKSGQPLHVLRNCSRVYGETGGLIAATVSFIDISEYVKAREDAREAEKAKHHFLAMISHEIRTPLNGIVGMTDLLFDTPLTPRQSEYAQNARVSADALLNLVNNLLDYTRQEEEFIETDEVRFSLHELVKTTVQGFAHAAREKKLDLRLELESSTPDLLAADAPSIRRVLKHLLDNAVKFTDQGEVRVSVTASNEDDSHSRIHIAVLDTGIGFAPEHQPHLIESFYQADDSASRRHGGAGLGLPICRQLVEHMRGELGAEPREAGGSVFWFSFPCRRLSAGEAEDFLRHAREHHPRRILLVEDNPLNQHVTRSILERANYECDLASSGREALQTLEQQEYDLVLMDCQMPVMDGYETTRKIRGRETTASHIPIIAITAHAMKGERERCLEAGMDDYLVKPAPPEKLLHRVERWLSEPGRPLTHPARSFSPSPCASPPSTAPSPPPSLDSPCGSPSPSPPAQLDQLLKAFGGNRGVLNKLLATFLQDAGNRLGKIHEAFETADAAAVQLQAHTIKGSALNLRAAALVEVAMQIERLARQEKLDEAHPLLPTLEREFETVRCYLETIIAEDSRPSSPQENR